MSHIPCVSANTMMAHFKLSRLWQRRNRFIKNQLAQYSTTSADAI
ncbi:MAG: hypothetical protein V4607_08265 [Pseudomonadota bacterium]